MREDAYGGVSPRGASARGWPIYTRVPCNSSTTRNPRRLEHPKEPNTTRKHPKEPKTTRKESTLRNPWPRLVLCYLVVKSEKMNDDNDVIVAKSVKMNDGNDETMTTSRSSDHT